MVIFWVLTVCGGVIRQYGNFYQNYNNFSKIVFSVNIFIFRTQIKPILFYSFIMLIQMVYFEIFIFAVIYL